MQFLVRCDVERVAHLKCVTEPLDEFLSLDGVGVADPLGRGLLLEQLLHRTLSLGRLLGLHIGTAAVHRRVFALSHRLLLRGEQHCAELCSRDGLFNGSGGFWPSCVHNRADDCGEVNVSNNHASVVSRGMIPFGNSYLLIGITMPVPFTSSGGCCCCRALCFSHRRSLFAGAGDASF